MTETTKTYEELEQDVNDLRFQLALINETNLRDKSLSYAVQAASGKLFENIEGVTLIVSAAEKFLAYLKPSQCQP